VYTYTHTHTHTHEQIAGAVTDAQHAKPDEHDERLGLVSVCQHLAARRLLLARLLF